ncbi:MAG: DNA polymerase III subunit gamma/tau [Candidatus Sericytochromatia bacterium]
MEHLALYRKWRPQRFSDLVGQDAISRTLLNAMAQDRLAHAYLFCGPRGTGKTSTARLLAKALNCEQPQDGEPCNACQSCEEITAGHSLDVIEIDAASNRGIDDARELREQVRFSASGGRYRVFIIDEFHMLTNEAFNALLKTLEEPPANVIFVLATTEPHKILPTIVSRCQRFDFQRIALPALLKHLQKVAAAEQIGVSAQALEAIARKAAGGGRDALSLLDQVHAMSAPGETLPDALVYQVLGLIDEETLLSLAQALFQSQVEPLLGHLQSLLEKGHDSLQIIQELLQLLRHLTLAHLPSSSLENLGVPVHLIPALKELLGYLTPGQSVSVIEQLLKTADRLHKVTQPEIWLEADLIQICLQAERSLLQRLEDLERGAVPAGIKVRPAGVEALPREPKQAELVHPLRELSDPVDKKLEDQRPPVAAVVSSDLASPEIWIPDEEPDAYALSDEPLIEKPQPVAEPVPLSSAISDSEMRQIWQRFLNRVLDQQGPLYGFMSNGKLVHIDTVRRYWIVRFASRPHRDRVEKSLKTGRLNPLLEEIMGSPFQMLLEMAGERAFVAPEPMSAAVPASGATASGERPLPPPPARDGSLPPPPVRQGTLPPPVRPLPPPRAVSPAQEIPPEAEEPPPLQEDPYAASAEPNYAAIEGTLNRSEPPPSPDSPKRDVSEPARRPASESSSSRPPAHQPLDAVAELFKGKVIRLDT